MFRSHTVVLVRLAVVARGIWIGDQMGAGDGAVEQARLAAERVAKLRLQLDHAERVERAWIAGAEGEARVARVLDELQTQGWRVLHDVRWPGRPKANLDHVLVGPGGVIVVDAKNWSGNVSLRDGMLRQNGSSREREVSGAVEQCAAVAALLEPHHRRYAQGWLCMVGQPAMHGMTASGAMVQGLDTLRDAVCALPAVLDSVTVEIIHHYLMELLSGRTSPPLLTTRTAPSSATDFSPTAGPAASLAHWRSERQMPVHPPTRPRGPNRKRSTGCLRMVLPLVVTVFLLGIFFNVLSQLQQSAPPAPRPTPSVAKTAPQH